MDFKSNVNDVSRGRLLGTNKPNELDIVSRKTKKNNLIQRNQRGVRAARLGSAGLPRRAPGRRVGRLRALAAGRAHGLGVFALGPARRFGRKIPFRRRGHEVWGALLPSGRSARIPQGGVVNTPMTFLVGIWKGNRKEHHHFAVTPPNKHPFE